MIMKQLLLFMATVLMVGCDTAMSNGQEACDAAGAWADAYFNCDYKDAKGEWQEVEGHTAYTVRKDCYNSVDFAPVKTTGLKILAKLQKGESGGVLEWKVNK